uniref:Connexin 32.3 n=1 Tax=Nothobranchius rachovii TaxID=451742 RepID=A0A1A8NKY7_9TELE
MGDWAYLSSLLDKVQSHSTVVGKIWMSVLFMFRIFVLGAAADKVWGDEQSEFYCDTKEPGCTNACYNWLFPISYVHYWVLQITTVSTPTLVYLGYAVHTIHREKRKMERLKDEAMMKKSKYTDDRGKVKIKGVLLGAYMMQLLCTILLEVGFAVAQFFIFGSISVHFNFHCKVDPCSTAAGAECFNSRATEKNIFIFFMFGVSGVSVLLNILEIIYLLCKKSRAARNRFLVQELELRSQHPPTWGAISSQYGGFPTSALPSRRDDGKHSDAASKDKVI